MLALQAGRQAGRQRPAQVGAARGCGSKRPGAAAASASHPASETAATAPGRTPSASCQLCQLPPHASRPAPSPAHTRRPAARNSAGGEQQRAEQQAWHAAGCMASPGATQPSPVGRRRGRQPPWRMLAPLPLLPRLPTHLERQLPQRVRRRVGAVQRHHPAEQQAALRQDRPPGRTQQRPHVGGARVACRHAASSAFKACALHKPSTQRAACGHRLATTPTLLEELLLHPRHDPQAGGQRPAAPLLIHRPLQQRLAPARRRQQGGVRRLLQMRCAGPKSRASSAATSPPASLTHSPAPPPPTPT